MNKKIMLTVFLGVMLLSSAIASQLPKNGIFNTKDNKTIIDWKADKGQMPFVEIIDNGAPNKKNNAIRFNKGKTVLRQQISDINIVAGKKYRMTAWVKNKNFQANRALIVIYGGSWNEHRGFLTRRFNAPINKWKKITVDFKFNKQLSNYVFAIVFDVKKGYIEIADLTFEVLED